MPGRGVLYIVWGDVAVAAAERSRRSLAKHHPELPVEFLHLGNPPDPFLLLAEKAKMMELSPFDETLFLDADTVVLGRLDFGFEQAARHGLACVIGDCPWARRYNKSLKGDIVEYNTGVLFFTRKAQPVFDAWRRLAPILDSSSLVVQDGKVQGVQPYNDQCAFAAAIDETRFSPFVLPINWNFRAAFQRTFFGPIRIWHAYDEPPQVFFDLAKYYESDDAIIQYADLK